MLRPMRPSDLPRGLALCRANGWNQLPGDWEQLLAMGGAGCLVAEVDGEVAGTLTSVVYQRRFAWIGMVLVEPALRGRGIGTALMHRALDELGDVEARLDATPQGEPLYARLGFAEESRLCRMTREALGPQGGTGGDPGGAVPPRVRPMEDPDLDAVFARDVAAFGADRADLLRWAFRQAPQLARVVEGESGLRGYCFGRPGYRWSQVGPVVADGVEAALQLAAACVSASGAEPLVIDSAVAVPGWTEGLGALGFVAQRPFVRMRRGTPNRRDGQGERQLAILGPEWG